MRHADAVTQVAGDMQTGVLSLQRRDRVKTFSRRELLLRDSVFVPEDTDHIRFFLFREFQQVMKRVHCFLFYLPVGQLCERLFFISVVSIEE